LTGKTLLRNDLYVDVDVKPYSLTHFDGTVMNVYRMLKETGNGHPGVKNCNGRSWFWILSIQTTADVSRKLGGCCLYSPVTFVTTTSLLFDWYQIVRCAALCQMHKGV